MRSRTLDACEAGKRVRGEEHESSQVHSLAIPREPNSTGASMTSAFTWKSQPHSFRARWGRSLGPAQTQRHPAALQIQQGNKRIYTEETVLYATYTFTPTRDARALVISSPRRD